MYYFVWFCVLYTVFKFMRQIIRFLRKIIRRLWILATGRFLG